MAVPYLFKKRCPKTGEKMKKLFKSIFILIFLFYGYGFYLFISLPNIKIISLSNYQFELPYNNPHDYLLEAFLPEKRTFPHDVYLSSAFGFSLGTKIYNKYLSKKYTICINKLKYKFPLISTSYSVNWFDYSGFEYEFNPSTFDNNKTYPKLIQPSSFPYDITLVSGSTCEGEIIQKFRANLKKEEQRPKDIHDECTKDMTCLVWFEEIL
jgi:hypothetical protein